MKRTTRWLPGLLILIGWACGSDPGALTDGDQGGDTDFASCSATSDCLNGGICAGSRCVPCSSDLLCEANYGTGYTCLEGVCTEPECAIGTIGCPCPDDRVCLDGECVDDLCVDCERGEKDCVCYDNDACQAGLRCTINHLCETCPEKQLNCPCDAGDECDAGLVCESDLCVTDPCPVGSKDCPCADARCDGSLICAPDRLCRECSADLVGCPCRSGVCLNDLVCDEGTEMCREPLSCAEITCVEHQLCEEPENADARCRPACTEGWEWNAGSNSCVEKPPQPNCQVGSPSSVLAECDEKNRVCVETASDASCGGCKPSFIDEGGSLTICRAVHACADIDCASTNRSCREATDTSDAACEECLSDYLEQSGVCYLKTCDSAGTPGSLVDACLAQHRQCRQPEEGAASCGDCLEGYTENAMEQCQLPQYCEELNCPDLYRICEGEAPLQYCGSCIPGTRIDPGDPERCMLPLRCRDIECQESQYCLEGSDGADAFCVDPLCPEGQAWREDESRCITECYVNCNPVSNSGVTGRIWLYTLENSDRCICETMPGYYWDEGLIRGAQPCDKDKDGWVRSPAKTYLQSDDPSLRQNARCDLRTIDRFVLMNEYQQRMEILLCSGDPPFARRGLDACASPRTLDLYETERNDDQEKLDVNLDTIPYTDDGIGRKLRAEEANSLTRACLPGSDYNDNQKSDMNEWHGMPTQGLNESEAVFAQFAYFVELHRGYYERGSETLYGQYVIQERSRCETGFPVVYSSASDYWRGCTRSRDSAYDRTDGEAGPDLGFDFARWSCDTPSGTCPIPPPSEVWLSGDGPVASHGLCDQNDLPPGDAECQGESPWLCLKNSVWRGMSHHSQFRCVTVSNEASVSEPRISLSALSEYDFNLCRVSCPDDDPDCRLADCGEESCQTSSEQAFTAGKSWSPVLKCRVAASPSVGMTGFAAARFIPERSDYARGCIDEWYPKNYSGQEFGEDDPEIAAWRRLCPGFDDAPSTVVGQSNGTDFGRIQCGCGNNYGGASCDLGCPTENLHLSVGYLATPRQGFWLCGAFSSTAFVDQAATDGPVLEGESSDGAIFTIRAEDSNVPIWRKPMCQSAPPEGDVCLDGFGLW